MRNLFKTILLFIILNVAAKTPSATEERMEKILKREQELVHATTLVTERELRFGRQGTRAPDEKPKSSKKGKKGTKSPSQKGSKKGKSGKSAKSSKNVKEPLPPKESIKHSQPSTKSGKSKGKAQKNEKGSYTSNSSKK